MAKVIIIHPDLCTGSDLFNIWIHIPSLSYNPPLEKLHWDFPSLLLVSTLLENVSQICQISTTTQALFKDVRTHPFTRVNPCTFASLPVIGPSG